MLSHFALLLLIWGSSVFAESDIDPSIINKDPAEFDDSVKLKGKSGYKFSVNRAILKNQEDIAVADQKASAHKVGLHEHVKTLLHQR